MINLLQLRRQVVARLTQEWSKSSDYASTDMIDAWLSEAYREINLTAKLYRGEYRQNSVLDQTQYDLPEDLLGLQILDLFFTTSASGVFIRPEWRTWTFLRENYLDFSNPDANHGPVHWAFDEIDAGKIRVVWPTDESVTNGLTMDYVKDPGDLSRVYEQASITASLTNGDATVTFSGAVAAGNFLAGDAFGIRASATTLPTRWYRISTITDTTHVELTETYEEANASTQLFSTAQISPLESFRPGLIQYAPVQFVVYRWREMEHGLDAPETIKALAVWENLLATIAGRALDKPGLILARSHYSTRHPAFKRV